MTTQEQLTIAKWLLDPDGVRELSNDLSALEAHIAHFGLGKVYREIELPLISVLRAMQQRGILVDVKILQVLRKRLALSLREIEKKIYQLAGDEFNLNSPKQLGEVLFDKLQIRSTKRTPGGARSTNVLQLEALRSRHPIIPFILEHRELFKLQSTYVVPLLQLASLASDHRIRTTFVQTGAATGRLSSRDPNLQNIPTGTPLASELRSAFIAAPQHSLVSLDYSQIELRVLASVTGDKAMIKAFHNDLDIHRLTASHVFNVELDAVTKEQRQLAKTLNFGVIYGMGPQAFARSTGKSIVEAEQFIHEYFADFPNILKWQQEIVEKAKKTGYVENLNGRKRWLPDLNSHNERFVAAARRAAINMPIQGLAADIVKLAMIRVEREFSAAQLLLSIHDELVFEIPDAMLKVLLPKLQRAMETVYVLAVPLKVDVAVGKSWSELQ